MKEDIEFTLIRKTVRQRFYKASRVLDKDASGKLYRYKGYKGETTLKLYTDETRTTTKEWEVPETFVGVVVSDAHTHTERLCFPLWNCDEAVGDFPYILVMDTIAGVNTSMIHGGDSRAVKPDEVYLRMIAKSNGFQYRRKRAGAIA